jgi:hypothetical protein
MNIASLKNTSNSSRLRNLMLVAQTLILISACITRTQGQQSGPNHPSMRDRTLEIQRVERNQLLLLKPLPAKKEDDSIRRAVLKQIKEDFANIQLLNNTMMAQAWASETLDYSYVSDMISRIRGKAVRLQMNLSLPESDGSEKTASKPNVSNSREFRAALLVLDESIMSFVTNPLFLEPNTIEVSQAAKARQDLEAVIELTADLKKIASKLAKASH